MRRPNYIIVDQRNLALQFSDSRTSNQFCVPTELDDVFRPLSPLEKTVYYEVLYRAVYAEDRRKGRNVSYKLVEPEPWMIALAYIMWEGIVQGLAWDAVKLLVRTALNALREKNLAPPRTTNKEPLVRAEDETTETELGFSWNEYSNDERKLYHMFIGLRRVHHKSSKVARKNISSSVVRNQRMTNSNQKSKKE